MSSTHLSADPRRLTLTLFIPEIQDTSPETAAREGNSVLLVCVGSLGDDGLEECSNSEQ